MNISYAYAGLAALLVGASWFDWRFRRIPNYLSLAIMVAGLAFSYALGGMSGLSLAGLHAVIALVVGMGLFAARVVGAGDAKLYAAAAAWFSVWDGVRLLVCVALSGLIVALIWAIARRRLGKRIVRAGAEPKDMLPYGVAISLGAILTILMELQLV